MSAFIARVDLFSNSLKNIMLFLLVCSNVSDAWNPMLEAFSSPSFNSYDSGATGGFVSYRL
jgi:hypothetical protein